MSTEPANIKLQRTLDERCKGCFLKTYQRLFEKYHTKTVLRQDFIAFYGETIEKFKYHTSPEIQRELNHKFCKIVGISDPFLEEKTISNQIAMELYQEWKKKVFASANPFDLALRLAIAGNIMDYGANNNFNLEETIKLVVNSEFAIDHSQILHQRIRNAKRILYLGDNAGEIVFDKLFIETIMHNDVVYAVKGSPVLNDVTMQDAKYTGMEIVSDIISNGYDAPSTVLSKCSKEFIKAFDTADLIISKGQGNLEGLINQNDARIFFLLMVKCNVIAEVLNVEKGSFVVYNQTL